MAGHPTRRIAAAGPADSAARRRLAIFGTSIMIWAARTAARTKSMHDQQADERRQITDLVFL